MSTDGNRANSHPPEGGQTNDKDTSYSVLEKELQSDGLFSITDANTSISQYSAEINHLRSTNKQLKNDLETEQDVVVQLRKRLNNAEKQKLDTASKTNEQIASLETQVAKLRSQIEKGEATRHNLEYELTKSQRELNHFKQTSKEKESLLMEGTDDLKQKIGDLSDEVKHLQKSLQTCKCNAQEQENKLRENLERTEEKFHKSQADVDTLRHERDKLNELCQKHSSVISELNERLQEFQDEKRNVVDSLRRATAELEYSKEREDRLQSDLQTAQSRAKTLEENIEAERAAHLETKFNSEIVQLRVRDLDGAVDVEKSANIEANKAIERLTQQNRELEQVYEEERKTRKEMNQKLDKMEKEFLAVKRQLSAEVEDKKTIIGNLSKELGTHQKNFNELKSELSKAKKRQQYLEETYGGSIKELEFLLHTFHFDDKKLRIARKEDSSSANKGKKVTSPTVVVESFKQMLVQLKRKMESQSEELAKGKKAVDKLSKELESTKELIKAKDKTIEDTQKNYTKTAKDLNKARANYAELESTIGKLKTSLQVNANNQDKDRTRIQELSEEIMKLVKRHRAEEEERIAFLHGLYQRLLSGHITVSNKDKPFNQFAWADLTDVVYEQVSALVDIVQASNQKLKDSHSSVRDQQEIIATLKHEHAEQISRLTNSAKEREAAWQQQKEELEEHYKQLISDIQSRSKKTQAIADQAWEKVRATGSVQQGLESEVVELRRELAEVQVQASSLLSACALLSGALFPLCNKAYMLASERHILEDLHCTWDSCRDRALYLASVLRSGKESDQDKPERDRRFQRQTHPLLRFRIGVIAVLAANRLAYLGQRSAQCFSAYPATAGDTGLTVHIGGLEPHGGKFTGVAGTETEDENFMQLTPCESQIGLPAWLSNSSLLEAVVTSMTELQEVTRHQNKEPLSPGEARVLASVARSSFSKLIDRLAQFFPETTSATSGPTRDKASLLTKLDRRLARVLSNTSAHLKGTLVTSQDLMSNLQNHILDLTQRLHTAEKERRRLLGELTEIKQQIEDGNNSAQDKSDKQSSKGTKYVPMSKFERVCVELSSALRREQKAQVLLQEQSNQLTELTSRLDLCASEGMHKQDNLVQLQENLSEAQSELRHKDQSLRQVSKQVAQTEYERDTLQHNLRDAENALHTVTRDREILTQYIKSVDSALDTAKRQFVILREPQAVSSDLSLSRLLLDAELIPQDIGKVGPELIAVQNLVGNFVEAQHQAVNKIKSLEEEITSHREHINTLKRELSNAVHREFIEQVDADTDGIISSFTEQTSSDKDVFVPLKEDLDDSEQTSPLRAQSKRLVTPPLYQSQKSAFQSVKFVKHRPILALHQYRKFVNEA